MENLLVFLPFLVPVVIANLGERRRWARQWTYGLVVAINVVLLGVVALALLSSLATVVMPEALPPAGLGVNWIGVAVVCLLTLLAAFLPLVPAVRHWLARWLPIDPGSTVHMLALVFAVYQLGLSLAQMALIGSLEVLTEAGLSLTIWDVLLSGLPLALFALVGVGLFLRRGWRETMDRLGLHRPTVKQILVAAVITALLLAFDFGVNLAWETLDPAGYGLLERVTESIFGGLMTVGGALALGLSAGICEEMLFRGAVQPRLGLLLASTLFAVGHLQYGLTVATLEVFIIGLVLGLVRNRTHTTVCILIHASYNAAGVLLGLLQP